jgi:hypothetical protein
VPRGPALRAQLERAGTPIGPYDALIAAQARRRSALLATANTREFTRVPGLKVVDWTGRRWADRKPARYRLRSPRTASYPRHGISKHDPIGPVLPHCDKGARFAGKHLGQHRRAPSPATLVTNCAAVMAKCFRARNRVADGGEPFAALSAAPHWPRSTSLYLPPRECKAAPRRPGQ